MRYLIALLFAGLLIGGMSLSANQASHALQQRMRQRLVEAKKRGEIPPDVDVSRGDLTDFNTEVSDAELRQIGILDLWFARRSILIPIVIIGCLAIARMTDRRAPGRPVAPVE